MEIIAALSHN